MVCYSQKDAADDADDADDDTVSSQQQIHMSISLSHLQVSVLLLLIIVHR